MHSVACRVLERTRDYAVLLLEPTSVEVREDRSYRYELAVNDDGWRWLEAASVDFDLNAGEAYFGGNCCYGTADTPHYAFAISDGVAILKVDQSLHNFRKPDWPGGPESRGGISVSDGLACWRDSSGAHCEHLKLAKCTLPARSSIEADGLMIKSKCPGPGEWQRAADP